MKIWKKNLTAAAVLVTVCAGIYVNWLYTEDQAVADFTNTLDEEKIMSADMLVMSDDSALTLDTEGNVITDYFAAVRLSRQEARDSAVGLLQEAMAYGEDAETAQSNEQLEEIVQVALCEAQIESLVIAKGYTDCLVFMGENVKGLLIHDKGKTIQTILKVLREDLDYYVPDPQIVNAMNFGVPQHRERVYIVGFRKDMGVEEFTYPTPTDKTKTFADIKEKDVVSAKYYLSTQYIKTLVAHKERHAAKGNGFGYEIIPDDGVANAIVVGGMGRERNLVIDHRLEDFTPVTNIKGEINRDGIRRMTPREWARLQGFPDNFVIAVADASAYKQFGNSVAVPAIQATAKEILKRINL